MNMSNISSSIIICIGLITILIGVVMLTRWLIEKEVVNEEEPNAKKYVDCHFKEINDLLDDIISYEFDMYSKYHPDMFNSGESYIKPDEMKLLVSRLTSKVFNRITPTIRNNLSLIYNFKSDEELINIIGEKIGILVVGLTATINNSMIDDTKLMEDLT